MQKQLPQSRGSAKPLLSPMRLSRLCLSVCLAIVSGVAVSAADLAKSADSGAARTGGGTITRGPAPRVIRIPDPTKLSPEEAVYVPPKLRKRVSPVYPYHLLRDGVAGVAKVVCLVDQDGNVIGTRLMESTRPEFGEALAAALRACSFASGTNEGEPIPTFLGFEYAFNPKPGGLPDLTAELRMLERELKRPRTISGAAKLDAPLQAIKQLAPIYPTTLQRQSIGGEAVIEFLLDEQGIPRLTRIISTSDPELGYAAAQAVSLWRFQPATAAGRPAALRVRVPFNFLPPSVKFGLEGN
jgi:TonB family protein